jgi:hypothetical protein
VRSLPRLPSLRLWLILAAVLVLGRAALPFLIKSAANHALRRLPGYSGRVDRVRLGLLRGDFELDGLRVDKEGAPGTLFSADSIAVSVRWRDLLRGAVTGEVFVRSPRADIVLQAPAPPAPPQPPEEPFQKRLAGMLPFRIDRFSVEDGAVRLRKLYGKPQVDQSMDAIRVEAGNLTNSRRVSKTLAATVRLEGRLAGHGDLRVNGDVNPIASSPTFNADMSLTDLDLTRLNPLFRQEAGVDLQKGRLSLYAECASADGAFKGYLKPMIKALDVSGKGEKHRSLGEAVKEKAADAVGRLFRNQRQDTDAARIPFSGRYDDPKVGMWQAVVTAFRHAFVRALKPGVERSVGPRDVGR